MSNLFSPPEVFLDTNIPLEDPKHIGNPVEYTKDIVELLEAHADAIESDIHRKSAMDNLVSATESLHSNHELSPEGLHLLIIARNHLMGNQCTREKKHTLESLREGSMNIHSIYVVEGFLENVSAIEIGLREKYKKLWDKAVHFYDNVIKRSGRIKNRALNLVEKIGDKDGYKSRPTIEMKMLDSLLIPTPNTSSGIYSLASTIKSGYYSGEAGDNLKKSMLNLKGYSLKSISGMEQMLSRIPDDPLDEISRGIIQDGFELRSNESIEEEGKAGTRVFYSRHGLLGNIFIIVSVHFTADRTISAVSVNYSHGKKSKNYKDVTTELPVLDVKEQKDTLAAVIELNDAVESYGNDKKKIRTINQEREKELFRLLSEMEKNKEALRRADSEGYKLINKYLHSLFNSLIVTESPMLIFTSSALDICDNTLDYVDKSIKVTKGFQI